MAWRAIRRRQKRPTLTPSLHSGQALTLSLQGRGDVLPRPIGERAGVRGSF